VKQYVNELFAALSVSEADQLVMQKYKKRILEQALTELEKAQKKVDQSTPAQLRKRVEYMISLAFNNLNVPDEIKPTMEKYNKRAILTALQDLEAETGASYLTDQEKAFIEKDHKDRKRAWQEERERKEKEAENLRRKVVEKQNEEQRDKALLIKKEREAYEKKKAEEKQQELDILTWVKSLSEPQYENSDTVNIRRGLTAKFGFFAEGSEEIQAELAAEHAAKKVTKSTENTSENTKKKNPVSKTAQVKQVENMLNEAFSSLKLDPKDKEAITQKYKLRIQAAAIKGLHIEDKNKQSTQSTQTESSQSEESESSEELEDSGF